MVKIEVGKLKIDDLFEYKGVIYEECLMDDLFTHSSMNIVHYSLLI